MLEQPGFGYQMLCMGRAIFVSENFSRILRSGEGALFDGICESKTALGNGHEGRIAEIERVAIPRSM